MCLLILVKPNFPELSFLYVCMLMVWEGHRDVLMGDLLGRGWSSSLLWLTRKAATRPATAGPLPGPSLLPQPHPEGPGFSRTPAPPRSKVQRITWGSVHIHGLQSVLAGFRLLPNLTSSSLLTACPVDVEVQHKHRVNCLIEAASPAPTIVKGQIPVTNCVCARVYVCVLVVLLC